MTERVDQLVPYGYTDATIATFHAFGDRLLREHALEAGLSDRSRVLSRSEQIIFLREHLFELPLDRYRPLGDPTRFLSALVTLFSRARDEDLTPDEYPPPPRSPLAEAGHQPHPMRRSRMRRRARRSWRPATPPTSASCAPATGSISATR